MLKNLLLAALLLFSTNPFVQAQTTKSLTWSAYNLSLQAPSDMVVRENSANVFICGNGKVFLSVYPGKGDSIGYNAMPNKLKIWAKNSKVNFSDTSGSYIPVNDRYFAYKIEGTDYRGKPSMQLLLVTKADPKQHYYAWLQFEDGYSAPARELLRSFKRQ